MLCGGEEERLDARLLLLRESVFNKKQTTLDAPTPLRNPSARPSDAAAWASLTGVAAAPALVFWPGPGQPPVVVQGSSISYAAEVAQHGWQAVRELHAASAPLLPACQLSGGTGGGSSPPGTLCALLLGRPGQRLSAAREELRAVQRLLSSSAARQGDSWEVRRAAQALASGELQLAWADASQQAVLCHHLLLWSAGRLAAACVCGAWWLRLPLAALGRCSLVRQAPMLVAARQQLERPRGGLQQGGRAAQLQVAAYSGSLWQPQEAAAWLAALAACRHGQPEPCLLQAAPAFAGRLAEGRPPRLASAALQLLHLASGAEVLVHRAVAAVASVASIVSWRQLLLAGVAAGGLAVLKQLLDALRGEGGL
jgi:hypothetical protein